MLYYLQFTELYVNTYTCGSHSTILWNHAAYQGELHDHYTLESN